MILDSQTIDKLIRAGRIAKEVRELAIKYAKPGMKLLDLAEYVEKKIIELGGAPAFPVNISINEVAAHYTPVIDDELIIPEGSVVKIDIGVHIDGYIADTAATVSFNPAYDGLLEATQVALEKALEAVKPGIPVNRIGKIICETIESMGYKPIRNLSGHNIDHYMIHGGKSIPNYYDILTRWKLGDGVYAIEPFATTGIGLVREGSIITIYSLIKHKKTRVTLQEKRLFDKIWNERRTLPFTERWYAGLFKSKEGLRNTLASMLRKKIIYGYPVLIERSNGIVAQFEHTFIINGSDIIITTR